MVCNVYVLIRVSTALTALILCSSSAACTGKASVQVGDSAAEVVEEKVTWSGPEPEPERVATSADASGVPEVATPVPSDGRSVDGIEQGKRVRPVATLPGFRMLDGGVSRVFVEVTGKTTVKEARRRGLLIYRLKGVRVPERVNRLALPTSHFKYPTGNN